MLPLKTKGLVLVLALGVLAASCASLQEAASTGQFDRRSGAFLRAVRWGEVDRLSAFFARGSTFPEIAALDEVKVTDVDAGPWKVTPDAMHITQSVTFKYYRTDTLVERSLTAVQVWRYDPEVHNWFLESGFPAFSPAE